MIDWVNLGSNALWIFGLSIALATLSYASWDASIHHEKLHTQLKKPGLIVSLNLAGLFFSLGMAATSSSILVAILWLILAILFAAQIIGIGLGKRGR